MQFYSIKELQRKLEEEYFIFLNENLVNLKDTPDFREDSADALFETLTLNNKKSDILFNLAHAKSLKNFFDDFDNGYVENELEKIKATLNILLDNYKGKVFANLTEFYWTYDEPLCLELFDACNQLIDDYLMYMEVCKTTKAVI